MRSRSRQRSILSTRDGRQWLSTGRSPTRAVSCRAWRRCLKPGRVTPSADPATTYKPLRESQLGELEAGGFEPPSRSGFSRSSTCVSVLLSLAAASRRRPLLAAASASVLGSSRRRARLGPVRWNDAASYPADWVGAAGRLCLGGHRQLVVGSCGFAHRIFESMVLGTQIAVHSSLSKPGRPRFPALQSTPSWSSPLRLRLGRPSWVRRFRPA